MRTPEEDDLPDESVCEPSRARLCCHRPPEVVEGDLLYAYQGLKDTTKGEQSVEDHLPTSITQGASNLHLTTTPEDKIKLLDSRSIPNMESTLEKMASCRYKTKMDKRSAFWQVELTPNAQKLLAFITPQGRVFKWKVMPFGVANAPALFQELMNKILSILRRRPKVQELISRGAQMEAHIDDVCLGTNTQEDPLILLGEFFAVCQENHTRFKLEKCEFMQKTMQYLGFDVGYGW